MREQLSSSQNIAGKGCGIALLPRVIRLRDAPIYLGMDKNRFNAEVRPYLIEFPIGSRGVAFDRLDLDAWLEEYILRTGRSKSNKVKEKTWDKLKLGPKVSTRRPMEQKQSVKLGKESEFFPDSRVLDKIKLKSGCMTKSKSENVSASVERALNICLQSVRRAI